MKELQQQYVISIMCRDRVGLVYEISNAISELQGNIADLRQSVLCGYFTMILLAAFPEDVTKRAIERKFAEVDSRSETVINVTVGKIKEGIPASASLASENTYVHLCFDGNRQQSYWFGGCGGVFLCQAPN